MTDLRRLGALSWHERLLVVEAAIALAAMRVAVSALPFRVLARLIGLERIRSTANYRPGDPRAAEVGWALRAAAAHAPWQSTCLVQALGGAAMLRRRGIASTLSLGVAKEAVTQQVIAHAWLRCGEEVLTGDDARDRFVELASFGVR
jgi:transglutaminase superfamily protein